ncbi:hypothetical protein GGI24_000131 [Coemansia furcata]|nr:hypothetical protein GGI24_000131 [Coemansia furcata]
MRDRSLLYNYQVTSSDETIYTTASALPNTDSRKVTSSPVHAMRRQSSKIADHHTSSVESYMSTNRPQHRRSASLLGRLRHPASMSPTASPTSSSECSSRDTRSERTLAHSASSGSMRHQHHYRAHPAEDTTYREPQRPSVRVLPPDSDGDGRRGSAKKRGQQQQQKNEGGKPGGFISQLLRGPSSSSKSRSPSRGLTQFARSSPGPPRSHMSPNASSAAGRKSPSSFADDSEVERHFSTSSSSPHMPQHHAYLPDQRMPDDYMGPPLPPSQTGTNYTPAAYFSSSSHHYHSTHADQGERSPNTNPNDLTSGRNNGGAWFDASDRGAADHLMGARGVPPDHLMSTLPVYEPIDMSRAAAPTQSSSSSSGYNRATQPTLPDARLLAPMASLTDIFPGISDFNALSNRELRFAVENHMLVEQHRYLIRDLGHARSAITALKQVVQAKEERVESYELANVELQQRVSLLESLLTGEQRQQLACMPYAFNMCSVSSELAHQSLHMQEQPIASDAETLQLAADLDDPHGDRQAAAAEARRVNRPLSGYVTGYSFNDKPVSHLPRVFSGDYSAANVQAMETSVEALANAIVAMPRDKATVEDIIASKCEAKAQALAATMTSECEASATDDPSPQPKRSGADQPKRRSRFFSALRLSAFNGSAAAPVAHSAADEAGPRTKNRRSVSLGNATKPVAVPEPAPRVPSAARARADSQESLAASCPTLLIPGIIGGPPRSARRQASEDSFGSSGGGGRYPPSLGLGDRASSQRVPSNASDSDEPHVAGTRAKRLSFTPQPRRSTSAPSSRPQSMRVSSRRSWLHQLFGSSSSNAGGSAAAHEPSESESESEAEGGNGGGGRRRRVMTQSSTEVAQLLGALQLSGEPAHPHAGHLEDVVDVSGEDEERAARPSLSVAEIRQQTLDALNGTLPRARGAQASTARQADEPVLLAEPSASRWRQHESAVPTIMRLNPPPVQAGSLGLGVSVARRGSLPNAAAAPMSSAADDSPGRSSSSSSANRRSQSLAQMGAGDMRPAKQQQSPLALDDDAAAAAAQGRRWAPAFWAPPPPALSPANTHSNTWSPRDSADSFESASIASRLSDDARLGAPRGSLSSSSRHRRGGSPWEMVRASESRTFSPTHSRPATPPLPLPSSARGLGFFEDTTVPDSDELTMAARRSLSLRMSRNAFKQAEPLPESDDTLDANSALESTASGAAVVVDESGDNAVAGSVAPLLKNNALARVAESSAHPPKRRSLLWQFNSKAGHTPPPAFNDHPLRSDCASVASDDLATHGDESIKDPCLTPRSAAALPKRPKKWWSAVLG